MYVCMYKLYNISGGVENIFYQSCAQINNRHQSCAQIKKVNMCPAHPKVRPVTGFSRLCRENVYKCH